MRKHILSHVRDLGVNTAGVAAPSSRVQSGHVFRPPLLHSAYDIAGERLVIRTFLLFARIFSISLSIRDLKFSDTRFAGGTVTVYRNNVLAHRIASLDGCPRFNHVGSCNDDKRVHRLRQVYIRVSLIEFPRGDSIVCHIYGHGEFLHFRMFLLDRLRKCAAGNGVPGAVR